MGGSPKATPPRDLYTETAGELKAKADLAPKVLATEQEFRPQYTALDLQSIDQLLKGIPGGTRDLEYTEMVTKYRNPITGEMSDSPRTTTGGSAIGTNRDGSAKFQTTQWEQVRVPVLSKRSVKTEATPGYLDIADTVADRVANIEARGLSAQRGADIKDVMELGPKSLEAIQASDPRSAALIESLTNDATDELALGENLNPAQLRLAQQSIRSRGQGTLGNIGPSGDFKEALGISQYAQNLRDKRRAYATGVVGLRQGVYGDGFNRVLGRGAAASPTDALSNAYGISQGAGPSMFGSSINANDVADSNFNAAAARNNAKANNNAAMTSAGISGAAGLASAGILYAGLAAAAT
jgi:hypothetical protein